MGNAQTKTKKERLRHLFDDGVLVDERTDAAIIRYLEDPSKPPGWGGYESLLDDLNKKLEYHRGTIDLLYKGTQKLYNEPIRSGKYQVGSLEYMDAVNKRDIQHEIFKAVILKYMLVRKVISLMKRAHSDPAFRYFETEDPSVINFEPFDLPYTHNGFLDIRDDDYVLVDDASAPMNPGAIELKDLNPPTVGSGEGAATAAAALVVALLVVMMIGLIYYMVQLMAAAIAVAAGHSEKEAPPFWCSAVALSVFVVGAAGAGLVMRWRSRARTASP